MKTRASGPFFAFAVLLLVPQATSAGAADEQQSFSRLIRPILSARCFTCHGPDEEHREADLRLDSQEGIETAFQGGLESPAWQRIVSQDDDLRMPPADSHLEIQPAELETLRQWVRGGAAWEGHWSFQSPSRPAIPAAVHADAVRNAIDHFIQARLTPLGLRPADEADREVLLRRVTLDLTGLPPTLAEIDAFLADDSPQAYEKVVDRLLASEQFGERMAVMWMDAGRYGDTSVFHADGPRNMWPWRDWVIDAYNHNMPFDQFTIEQLAGDLLPEAKDEQRIATGFLRNNATTDEGGAIAEEFRVEYAIDRVKTVSMVWLGLSMECAQCHGHKYDPISQRDYYRFFAYFNQSADPGMQSRQGNQTPVQDLFDEQRLESARQEGELARQLHAERTERQQQAEPEFAAWLDQASTQASHEPVLPEDLVFHVPLDETKGRDVADVVSSERRGKLNGPVKWTPGRAAHAFECNQKNFIDFADAADFERTDAFSYGCWIKPKGAASGAPLARMDDRNAHRGFDLHLAGGIVQVHLIHAWPGNSLKIRGKKKLKPDAWQHVFVTYDGQSKPAGLKIYVDGQLQEVDVEQNNLSKTIRTQVPLYLGRRNPGSAYNGLIDDVRIYGHCLSADEVAAVAGNDPIRPLLVKVEKSDEDIARLRRHFLETLDATWMDLTQRIQVAEAKVAELEKPVVNVMVMKDIDKMRPTYILDRGNYASPRKDEELQPGVPAVLPPLTEGAVNNRLGLARWLVRSDHPLTARVTVNRYWSMLFGEGLVRTLEDFGMQGEAPTHPELLDWLAVDFVENGWDIKRMIKMMVMSGTYRQSARVTPAFRGRDPRNRWLARGPRFRLQAEFVRDNALAIAGLLVPTVGGPGVKPYQPPGLWNEVSLSGNVRFVRDDGDKLYRRSLYIYWKRSAPAPAMTLFDAPTREKCVLRRSRTNTPLQALVTMNDTQFVEAARAFAQRTIHEGGRSLDEQLAFAYRTATGMRPSAAALAVLRKAYTTELQVFQSQPERAGQLLDVGASARDDQLDAAGHAAMTVVCSILLNLDATLTRG